MNVQVGSRYSVVIRLVFRFYYCPKQLFLGEEEENIQLTIQSPIPPLDALPFALALLFQARHVDVQLLPLDVYAGIAQVHLDNLGVDIVANLAIGAQAVEEPEYASIV